MTDRPRRPFLPRPDSHEETFLGRLLRQETVGGAVVLVAALVAVLWANSPWAAAYDDLRHLQVGPLDLEHWAADGALTIFFYVAGLELKRELLVGSLRRPSDALVPVVAAVAGVADPGRGLRRRQRSSADGDLGGWAVPAATDIAFALAVLAVVGQRPARPAPRLPAHPGRGRRPRRHRDHRGLLHRVAATSLWLAARRGAAGRLRCSSRGSGASRGSSTSRCRWRSGGAPTRAACTPRSPASPWACATRVLPDEGEDTSPAEQLEHLLTPGVRRCRRPVLRADVGRRVRSAAAARCSPTRWRSASCSASSSASRSACSAAPGSSPG